MNRKTKPNATLADADVTPETMDRLMQVQQKLDAAQEAVALGKVAPAETSGRLALFKEREVRKRATDPNPPRDFAMAGDLDQVERIMGSNDILTINFFHRGMTAARSIGCILKAGERFATGFLVAPHMLMTNNHVLAKKSDAHFSAVEFELTDPAGRLAEVRQVSFDPDRFWFTDENLDITIVALADTAEAVAATADLGWHPMISQQGKIRIGDPVNIIQHPGGRPKSVVVHNSNLLHLENDTALMPYAWYNSDTEPGSSGSPVFNRHWEVVAVHRRSVPRTDKKGQLLDINDKPIPLEDFERNHNLAVWIANEGSRTSQIVAALERATFSDDRQTFARDELLSIWEGSRHRNQGQTIAHRAATTDAPKVVGAGIGSEAALLNAPVYQPAESLSKRVADVSIQITINTGRER